MTCDVREGVPGSWGALTYPRRGRSTDKDGMPTTRSRAAAAAAADPCSICFGQIDERFVLPCSHEFCRGCVDELFCRHAEAGDYASRCPQCRQPLFGQADIHFTGGMQLLDQISEGQSITSVNAAVELFELCISDVQPYASGPNGLNRTRCSRSQRRPRLHGSGAVSRPQAQL